MANENKLTDSRMTDFAKRQTENSSRYVNLGNLSLFAELIPPHGMEYFSIAVRVHGEWNDKEYTRVLRLGLRPVKAAHHPECKLPEGIYYPEGKGPSNDVIEIGGHLLMECPIKDAEAFRENYARETRAHEARVHNAYVDDGSAAQFGITGHRYT